MNAAEAAALAAIDAVYAEPVTYVADGFKAKPLMVVWSDVAGDPFQGAGNTVRIVSAEIYQSDLSGRPAKADRLIREGVHWQPIDVTKRDDLGKWIVVLDQLA
jgi:hypothetical protein